MGGNQMCINRDLEKVASFERICELLTHDLKSTQFSVCEKTGNVSLLGSRGDHLRVDTEFEDVCKRAGIPVPDGGPGFHSSKGSVDFCLEDGLSGLFLSRLIFGEPQCDWVILHLDDHRDMMPTLLAKTAGGESRDPETGEVFEADREQHWHTALKRGTLTIGNYLVPLFHQKPAEMQIHIRHLRPKLERQDQTQVFHINTVSISYATIEALQFAAVALENTPGTVAGTYSQSDTCGEALLDLPEGRLAVHIDLDYFVNDFNGNPDRVPLDLGEKGRISVLKKMDGLFGQVAQLDRPVERWIIATSPGFCASRHWAWLMEALETRICALTGDERHRFLG